MGIRFILLNVITNIKKVISDTLFISKYTNTNNKKRTIIIAVLFSQTIAILDIVIILFFTQLLTGVIEISDSLKSVIFIFEYKQILPLFIVLRYLFQYWQNTLLKKMELSVQINLKVRLLSEVFEKRNYSVADAYYYINTLTSHIAYFYSSISSFLNYLLQTLAFSIFLFISEPTTISIFVVGIVILLYPITFLIKKAREFMHSTYEIGQDANHEIQRVVDNMFLIKLLGKESEELKRFGTTLKKLKNSIFNNFRFSLLNSFLPSFITVFLLSIIIIFFNNLIKISLDFVGVTLRMFQSLGLLSNAANQVLNSHIHLEKFYEINKARKTYYKENFKVSKKESGITFTDVSFKYYNSDNYIFENLNLRINKNSQTIISGSNGSGKSTLLGLMAGVYFPEKGKIESFTDRLGFVGPTPLIFNASLKENLLYGNNSAIDEVIIQNLVDEFKLFNESNHLSLQSIVDNKSLSSGQMQKIAFIRALLNDIEILFLDESTSNLDKESKKLVLEILKKKDLTVINSTHDLKNLEYYQHHIEIEVIEDKRRIIQIT